MNRDWRRGTMFRDDFLAEMNVEDSSTMLMDVDDDNDMDSSMDMFGDVGGLFTNKKPKDKFFNLFEDDFDDSDIN